MGRRYFRDAMTLQMGGLVPVSLISFLVGTAGSGCVLYGSTYPSVNSLNSPTRKSTCSFAGPVTVSWTMHAKPEQNPLPPPKETFGIQCN